jgi:hypothetical protein
MSSPGKRLVSGLVRRLALALALPLAAVPARADNIDTALADHGPRILAYLRGQGYHNVGVLKFRVRKGGERPTLDAGAMNGNMVVRLENLLVLASPEDKPVGLIRDAGRTIARTDPHGNYLDAAGRRKLFDLTYRLAAGNKVVQADAFLTGIVELSPDLLRTTVQICAFGRSDPKAVETVVKFTVATDRSILADVGRGSVMVKRPLGKDDVDKEGKDPNSKPDPKPDPGKDPHPDSSKYLEFKVYYDGKVQDVQPDAARKNERIAEPHEGQKVHMTIRNVSKQSLGVVLKVNGKSTLFDQDDQAEKCQKWVLDPGEEYTIKGYYRKDETVVPFSVQETRMPPEGMDVDRVGEIELVVFEGTADKEHKVSKDRTVLSLRGRTRANLDRDPPRSFAELRQRVLAATRTRTSRGLIVPDAEPEKPGVVLKLVDFDNPQPLCTRIIRYADPRKVKDDKGE